MASEELCDKSEGLPQLYELSIVESVDLFRPKNPQSMSLFRPRPVPTTGMFGFRLKGVLFFWWLD